MNEYKYFGKLLKEDIKWDDLSVLQKDYFIRTLSNKYTLSEIKAGRFSIYENTLIATKI